MPSAFRRLHHGPGQFRPLAAGVEDLSPASRWETWRIVVAEKTSTTRLRRAQRSRIPKNRGRDTPLSRGLQFDDSPFQSDCDRVGSVVRAKFREDVLDVSLNGFLSDGQFIGDQFVGVSSGNRSKDFDFSDRQSVIRNMISDLRGKI